LAVHLTFEEEAGGITNTEEPQSGLKEDEEKRRDDEDSCNSKEPEAWTAHLLS
jgi:hypothetical protein